MKSTSEHKPYIDINLQLWGCVKCGCYMRAEQPPKDYVCKTCRRKNSYVKCEKSPTNPNGA